MAAQSDGKILIGGQFMTYEGVYVRRIIRINADGSQDTSFNIGEGFNNTVNTLAVQSDGKTLIGGVFTGYQGAEANRIIRLNSDGSRDTSFNIGEGFNNTVNNIAIQSDGRIIVGGLFTSYQGLESNRIIRLNSDGSIDTSFNIGTGFNSNVNAIAIQSDGKILLGGNFTSYQGVAANRIIRLNSDGNRDTSFNIGTGFNGNVTYIVIQLDGRILVGGSFTNYQGVGANYLLRLNANGSRDTGFSVGAGGLPGGISSIAIQSDGKIIIGGQFTTYQGAAANRIIRLNANGSRDTGFNTGAGFVSWTVQSLLIQNDGKILVGGRFETFQQISVNRIARLNSDGSRDTSFNIGAGFQKTVNTLAIQEDGKIVVGGSFNSYQDVIVGGITRLNTDGSKDNSFSSGSGFNLQSVLDPGLRSIKIQSDGKILAGGSFTSYQGVGANYIIRLNSDGSRDTSFNLGTGFNNVVNTIFVQSDGKIIVGGNFTTYQGVAANRIIRLNSNGSRDNSFNIGTGFSSWVNTIALQNDGKIMVGGDFGSYQGTSTSLIIRLNSDGSRDNSFDTGSGFQGVSMFFAPSITSINVQEDGKILAGGSLFNGYQGEIANSIVRLNSDGSRDNNFNMGVGFGGGGVSSIFIQSDGKILIGGLFSSYQQVGANRIIRLNSDGNRDTSFNIGTGFNSIVNTLTLQSDGKILAGGSFTNYQNQPAGYLIRLWN
jgi:uncharacterized delta-60 repeat protein